MAILPTIRNWSNHNDKQHQQGTAMGILPTFGIGAPMMTSSGNRTANNELVHHMNLNSTTGKDNRPDKEYSTICFPQ